MISTQLVHKLQSDYSVLETGVLDMEEASPYAEYLAECREYHITNKPGDYTHKTATEKNDLILSNIQGFIKMRAMKVRGFVNEKGLTDIQRLTQSLYDSMTGYGILKPAIYDETIDEVQINDYLTVFVVRGGVEEPYLDENGNPVQFESPDELETVLNKLIDGGTGEAESLTNGKPLLNEKTHEHHYRVNAVHSTVNTRGHAPYDFPITMITLRKFKEIKLTLTQIVNAGACTEQMGHFTELLGRADVRLFCVGPTASGKTTLLNSISFNIPLSKRILLVQNPTEISFFQRDQYGRMIRNVGHWQVTDYASMSKLTSNTLRASPVVIIAGEARDAEEFAEILRLASTGHRVLGTYHAESALDAIYRFGEETNSMDNLARITKAIDFIITQFKFDDGYRRIMEMAEIEGCKNNEPVVRVIFEFRMSGKTKTAANGRTYIDGDFYHVNPISRALLDKFYKAGISLDEIKEFVAIEDGGAFETSEQAVA